MLGAVSIEPNPATKKSIILRSAAALACVSPIDNKSGVGTQVMIVDLDGKAPPEIVVGNKKGAFVSSSTVAP